MLNLAMNVGPPAKYQDPLLAVPKLSILKRNPLQVFRILQYLLVSYILVDIQVQRYNISSK